MLWVYSAFFTSYLCGHTGAIYISDTPFHPRYVVGHIGIFAITIMWLYYLLARHPGGFANFIPTLYCGSYALFSPHYYVAIIYNRAPIYTRYNVGDIGISHLIIMWVSRNHKATDTSLLLPSLHPRYIVGLVLY